MSPATGTPTGTPGPATIDDPRALARRALSLAMRSPSCADGVSDTVEFSRRFHAREIGDDAIDSAIALIETHTRPGPIAEEAIELLLGLKESSRGQLGVSQPSDDHVEHHSAGVEISRHERSILSIVTIEGRGIWIELAGALVEPGCDAVAERLGQLGALDFAVAVVDVRRVTAFDVVGHGSVVGFVEPIVQAGGTVHLVDPEGRLGQLVDLWQCGIVHGAEPPMGNWWV